MQVMDAITEILKREGVSTLFCFPTTPIIEAAVAAGIRPVICRQERVGVHMADGCARVTNGRPARRLCDAVRAGRRERLCRHRLRLFRIRPRSVSAARPSARDGADVPAVQFDPHLCLGDQAGRAGEFARARSGDAARLQRAEERPLRPGHGRGAGRCDDRRVRRQPGRLYDRCAAPARPATNATSTRRRRC